jgi:hypothetical protein
MAQATLFPRHIVLAAASISGVLLALAVHMLGVRFGLDLGGLWRQELVRQEFGATVPVGAAMAWWLIAAAAFGGGYLTANVLRSAASGTLPPRMRQFLIAVGVLVLAGAGQAASAPSPIPSLSGVLAGVAALALGGLMAFSGAHVAMRGA